LSSEKVLITGGAGFIGSHLADELVREGYFPVIFDDLSSGRMANITHLLQSNSAQFVRGSVNNVGLLRGLAKGVRYVFHLAAIASVPASVADPLASHEVNVTGSLNVLLAARDAGVGKVVFASSCAVYGDAGDDAVKESTPPHPLSPYAAGKLAAEHYCQVFSQVYGLPTACLRYFNVYGPRQDPASDYAAVIPAFIERVAAGQPPVIYGDGAQTRDFIYVKDVARANIWAAETDAAGVYNIGSGVATSVNELAGLLDGIMNSNLEPVHEAARGGDIRHSRADVSRAVADGYQAEYSLKAGLEETVESFRGN